jgi:hypothetical protein
MRFEIMKKIMIFTVLIFCGFGVQFFLFDFMGFLGGSSFLILRRKKYDFVDTNLVLVYRTFASYLRVVPSSVSGDTTKRTKRKFYILV